MGYCTSNTSGQPGQLPGTVTAGPAGTAGFDTTDNITSTASNFYAQGKRFAIRYLSLSKGESSDSDYADLTKNEANAILAAKLPLMAVQHAFGTLTPTCTLGTSEGQIAAANAQEVGLPGGINVWLDVENVASGSAVSDIEAYVNNWAPAVSATGYVPGVYVGAPNGLTADQLGSLNVQHFWMALSTSVPSPSGRGYQMIQSANSATVDNDKTQNDSKGGTVLWLAP